MYWGNKKNRPSDSWPKTKQKQKQNKTKQKIPNV